MNVKLHQLLLVALAIILTAALGLADPLSAAGPQAEGKKGKIQHKTFSSPDALLIPNGQGDPYPSTIKVSGFKKGKVKDVNVQLRGFNHGCPDNVDVMLVAPNGENAMLMSDAGSCLDALSLTLTLDDAASDSLPDGGPLASGTFRPANYLLGMDPFPGAPAPSGNVALSTFNGGNPNGAWQLFVIDDGGVEVGAFSGGWDLEITAKVKKHKKH